MLASCEIATTISRNALASGLLYQPRGHFITHERASTLTTDGQNSGGWPPLQVHNRHEGGYEIGAKCFALRKRRHCELAPRGSAGGP